MPVTIASTNSPVASSEKDLWKAAVPASLSTGSPKETSGSGAAICVKVPSLPTKMPEEVELDGFFEGYVAEVVYRGAGSANERIAAVEGALVDVR